MSPLYIHSPPFFILLCVLGGWNTKLFGFLLRSADGRDWQEIQGQEREFEVFIFLFSCLLGYGLAAALYLRLLAGGPLLLLLSPCSSGLVVNSAAASPEYYTIPCKVT